MTRFIDPSDDGASDAADRAIIQRKADIKAAQEARDAPKTRPTVRWSNKNRNT